MNNRAIAYALRRKCSVYLPPKVAAQLDIRIEDDDRLIAFTDGSRITLGTKFREVFQKDPSAQRDTRQFVFYAGLCAHELAHLLYTHFDLKRKIINDPQTFLQGQACAAESLQNLKNPSYLGWVMQIQNIFEDAFIEWKFKNDWGGGYLSNCLIWTRYFVYDHDKADESQIPQMPPYNIVHNFLLDFCIFRRPNLHHLTDEQKGWIAGALQILQPVLQKVLRQNGKESFLTAFELANYISSLYPACPSAQQMASEGDQSRCYSTSGNVSSAFQKDAQRQSQPKGKDMPNDPKMAEELQKALEQLQQQGPPAGDEGSGDSGEASPEGTSANRTASGSYAPAHEPSTAENESDDEPDTDIASEQELEQLLDTLTENADEELQSASQHIRQEDMNNGVWENDYPYTVQQDERSDNRALRQEVQPTAKILARSYIARFKKAQTPSVRCYDKGQLRPKFVARQDMMYFDGGHTRNAPVKIALQLLLDGSGSMRGRRAINVAKVAVMIAVFCREVGIPLSVYWHSFMDAQHGVGIYRQKEFDEDAIDGVSVHDCYGCNRDGQAIRIAAKNLAGRPEPHKILLLLSDGQPTAYVDDDEARADIAYALNFCRRKKIEFIAGAFADDKDALKALYGEKYLEIPSLGQFAPNFINRLKKLIK